MADYPVTLARTRMNPLSLQENAQGFTHKYTIPYGDVAVATATSNADTITITLGSLPALWKVRNAGINITTPYAGTTALTVVVGTTTTTNAFVTSQSVMTAAWLNGASISNATITATATKDIVAVFTNATGGSPSALTAGSLDIYLAIDNNIAGRQG